MDNWKPIEPKVWKPKETGESIIGVVVNKTPKDESTGLSAKYQLENEQGMFLIWGSVVLDDRMQYVAVGSKGGSTLYQDNILDVASDGSFTSVYSSTDAATALGSKSAYRNIPRTLGI